MRAGMTAFSPSDASVYAPAVMTPAITMSDSSVERRAREMGEVAAIVRGRGPLARRRPASVQPAMVVVVGATVVVVGGSVVVVVVVDVVVVSSWSSTNSAAAAGESNTGRSSTRATDGSSSWSFFTTVTARTVGSNHRKPSLRPR